MPKKKATGRPSKYNPEYHIPWARSLAMQGATDAEMCKAFDISESTFNLWKKKHPDFSESLKKGKGAADSDVFLSLYKRALGYDYTEKKVIVNYDNSGKPLPRRIETVEKHVPADITAVLAWLNNRMPDQFRQRQADMRKRTKDTVMDNILEYFDEKARDK